MENFLVKGATLAKYTTIPLSLDKGRFILQGAHYILQEKKFFIYFKIFGNLIVDCSLLETSIIRVMKGDCYKQTATSLKTCIAMIYEDIILILM